MKRKHTCAHMYSSMVVDKIYKQANKNQPEHLVLES